MPNAAVSRMIERSSMDNMSCLEDMSGCTFSHIISSFENTSRQIGPLEFDRIHVLNFSWKIKRQFLKNITFHYENLNFMKNDFTTLYPIKEYQKSRTMDSGEGQAELLP